MSEQTKIDITANLLCNLLAQEVASVTRFSDFTDLRMAIYNVRKMQRAMRIEQENFKSNQKQPQGTSNKQEETQGSVKLYGWSHCGGEWMFYSYFNTNEEALIYIDKKGYGREFFRFDEDFK